jgi:hypothetical protein
LVFGGAAGYCLIGAIRGHLFIPNRYLGSDSILSGPAAWGLFFSVLAFWSSVMVRQQAIIEFNIHRGCRNYRNVPSNSQERP